MAPSQPKSELFVGLNKGHIVTKRELAPRPSSRKGKTSMKEGKGKRLWKKVKYQLVEYHSLPAYLRDNEYIIGHYRSEWPLKQALLILKEEFRGKMVTDVKVNLPADDVWAVYKLPDFGKLSSGFPSLTPTLVRLLPKSAPVSPSLPSIFNSRFHRSNS